jgi:hypothetical protein
VLQGFRVRLLHGLMRTNSIPTSMPTTRKTLHQHPARFIYRGSETPVGDCYETSLNGFHSHEWITRRREWLEADEERSSSSHTGLRRPAQEKRSDRKLDKYLLSPLTSILSLHRTDTSYEVSQTGSLHV